MNCKISLLFVLLGVVSYVRSNILQFGVPCSTKMTIIETLNEMRTELVLGNIPRQPKAGNLQTLSWDDELGELAQFYANQTILEHNANRNIGGLPVGENLYYSGGHDENSRPKWKDVLDTWYNENEVYNYVPFESNLETENYTQLIWADTIFIGCGYTLFERDGDYYQLYVCNYGPPGNIETKNPYELEGFCDPLCCKGQCSLMYGEQCTPDY